MKNKFLLLFLSTIFLSLFFTNLTFAQEEGNEGNEGFDITNPMNQQSLFETGLGYTRIGDQNLIGFRFKPELVIGKLGFGLDIPLQFDMADWTLRKDEYQSGVGILRMIRYLSWGVKKRDPFYIRVGDISGSYLGYGILINNFTNATSFEKRKVGVELDFTIAKLVGMEMIYSDLDFASLNMMAIRPYIRPFGRTSIPVVKTFEIGGSYVIDKDDTKIDVDDDISIKNTDYVNDGLTAIGADAGVIFFNFSFMQYRAFAQYAKINKINSDELDQNLQSNSPYVLSFEPEKRDLVTNYGEGTGFSVGSEFRFKFLGNLLRIHARLERLWYSDYFIPQFFDASYEMNKDARILELASTEEKKGIYGNLTVSVLDKIMLSGGLMIPDEVSATSPAMIQLNLDASQLFDKFVLKGTYYKGGLSDLGDALKLDERSLASARVGYKMYKVLIVGLDYKWTFATQSDGTFETSNYISPFFGLSMPLNFGGKKDKENYDELD